VKKREMERIERRFRMLRDEAYRVRMQKYNLDLKLRSKLDGKYRKEKRESRDKTQVELDRRLYLLLKARRDLKKELQFLEEIKSPGYIILVKNGEIFPAYTENLWIPSPEKREALTELTSLETQIYFTRVKLRLYSEVKEADKSFSSGSFECLKKDFVDEIIYNALWQHKAYVNL